MLIILFHLKLDKCYCIGVMSWLKVISYGFVYSQTIFFFNSFCSYKNDYYWFNREELVEPAKNKYQNGGGKKSN